MRDWRVVLVVVIAGLPVVASAEDAPKAKPPADEVALDDDGAISHEGQVGFHLRPGLGYRFIAPYDNEYCGQAASDNPGEPRGACAERAPLFLDLGASYGVTQSLELLFETRVGLEREFGASLGDPDDGPRPFAIAPGIRVYINDAGVVKFHSSFQVVVDFTDFDQVPETDYGIRNVNGLQFDFHRTVGVFVAFGETLAVRRWFRFEMDASVGFQARFP
jgi:hypothetical protein